MDSMWILLLRVALRTGRFTRGVSLCRAILTRQGGSAKAAGLDDGVVRIGKGHRQAALDAATQGGRKTSADEAFFETPAVVVFPL